MKKLNLNQILTIILAGLFLCLVASSAVLLCKKNAVPGSGLRKIEKVTARKGDLNFDLIGLMRISTKPDSDQLRHVMVLTPWLEYDASDSQLYEELDRKLVSIKSIINGYFSTRTKDQLLSTPESQIKAELVSQINEVLVLGKITQIYFKDYIFLN